MKTKQKNLFMPLGAATLFGMPVALAASCSTSGSTKAITQPTTIQAKGDDLKKVTVSGDTAHPIFTVPTELTNINENKVLSASGKTAALRVYGRTTLSDLVTTGEGANKKSLTNTTFMPLKLLEYYMSGQLSYETVGTQTKLVATAGTEKIDINQRFGSLFGFNNENYKPTLIGIWKPESFELRYYPEEGYTTTDNLELEKIITPGNNTAKTFFNFRKEDLLADLTSPKFEYTPTSTHDAVVWSKKPAVEDLKADFKEAASGLEYSVTEDAGAVGTSDLPNEFVFSRSDRKLFVKLIAKSNFVIDAISNAPLDVTEISKVQDIVTKIDKFPGFAENDLSQISISAVPKQLIFAPYESGDIKLSGQNKIAFPTEGAALVYQIGTRTDWVLSTDLNTELRKLTGSAPVTIKAKFDTLGDKNYLLENNKEATITNNFVSQIDTQKFINDAAKLVVDQTTSSTSQIQFKNIPVLSAELSAQVNPIEYLLGDYATPEIANSATAWSTNLPASSPKGSLKFYARIRPKTPSANVLTNMLIDLTDTSQIKTLLLLTDATGVEAALRAIKVTGQNINPAWTQQPALTSFSEVQITKIEYLVGDYATTALAAKAEGWSASLPQSLDFVFAKRHLFARILAKEGYRVANEIIDLTATSGIQNVQSVYNFDAALLSATLNGAFEYSPSSNHANVTWTKSASYNTLLADWKTAVTSIKFSLNADGSNSSATVPTAFNMQSNQRKLYVVLVPGNNIVLTQDKNPIPQNVVDVTLGSGIQELRTRLDDTPGYNAITNKLSAIRLTINPITPSALPTASGEAILILPTLTIPTGAVVKYLIDADPTLYTGAELISRLSIVRPAPTLTIKARFVVTDTSKFVIENNKEETIINDLISYVNTSNFMANALSMKVSSSSILPNSITFENVPTLPADLQASVAKIEYLIGDYSTVAAASAATTWTETVPTSIALATNNFYIRLVPKPGFILQSAMANLTATSGIAALPTLASATDVENYLNSITASGVHNAISYAPPATGMPVNAQVDRVEYLIGNYASLDAAKAASGWVATLPIVGAFEFSERFLYARIVPKSGFAIANSYIDLTASSGIKNVKGLIDALPGFSAVDLSKIKATGNLGTATFDTSLVALPSQSEIRYRYDNGALMTEAEFKTFLTSQIGIIAKADFSKIKALLISKNIANYVLKDNKATVIDTTGLDDITTLDVPTTTVTAFNNLKVLIDSTSESVTWENLPALGANVDHYEFLSGNYATTALASSAPTTEWKTSLPTTVDYSKALRFFYVRIVPKAGYSFNNSVLDLTASSGVKTLTTDVTARHVALRTLLGSVTPVSTSVHNSVTWNSFDLSAYTPFFTVEYLSSTAVTTPNGALLATTGYSASLPGTLDFTQSSRYLYARLTLKPDMVSNETNYIVDMSPVARSVKSDIAFAPGFSAMNLSKIEISGGLVNAVISSSTAGVLAMVNPGYTMTGITGYVSATNFIAYLKNNFGTIQQSDLSTIRVKAMINEPGKYVNTVDTIWTPNVTDLKLVVEKQVPAALRTAIEAMRVSGITTLATWNPGLPSIAAYNNATYGVKRLEIAIATGPDKLFDSIQGANDRAAWQTALRSDAGVHNADLRYMYVRVVPLDGYVFTDADNAIIDVTTTSGLRNLTINVTDNHNTAITEINALVASTSSVHNAVVWSTPGAPTVGKTFRLYYEFLYSNTVASLDAAKLEPAASWGQMLPTSIDPVHANRHLYAKITIAPGGFSTNPNLYLDLSAKVQAIKTNDDALTGFDQIDLSKITIKGALIDAAIDEAPANLISAGVTVNYAIAGKTAYMSKAAFITYLKNNFVSLSAADVTNISARLAVSDGTKYVITDLKTTHPETAQLNMLKKVDAPSNIVAGLNGLKVVSTSDIKSVAWNNDAPVPLDQVLTIEYLSGNYATTTEALSVPDAMWQKERPLSVDFDATKRFFYAKLMPIPGYEFNQSIYDLTTTSEIRTLLQDVSSQHASLLVELAKIAPLATATHANATWDVPNLETYDPYFVVQYFSSTTVKTLSEALASSTGWTSALPTTLDYTHASRHLYARLILKAGNKSTQTTYGVDLSAKAQGVKTDLNAIVTSATVDPSKIMVSGYYVDATVNTAALQLPSGVELRYEIAALNVTNLTETTLTAYLKDHVADIMLAVKNSITAYVTFDATKFILTSVPRGLVDVSKLTTPKPYDVSALIYQLQTTELKAGSLVNALAWNNFVTTFTTPTTSVEYYVGTEATELEVATKTGWTATLPTTLPSALLDAPETAKLWARINSQVGYVASSIYVDLTTSSRIGAALKLIPQAMKDALAAALQGAMTHLVDDRNTGVHYTVKTLDTALAPYFKMQFLQGNFTTEAEAKAATSWVDRADYIAPTTLVFTQTNRPHVWARIVNLMAFEPVASYIDLTPVVVDVISDIATAPDYPSFDLSKLLVVLNSLTAAPIIEETAIGLPHIPGSGYEFSYKQNAGLDVWQSQADFIADTTTNAAALRALTFVKVRLINADPIRYYLDPINNKETTAQIAFRYDRVWKYKVSLADPEVRASLIGNFNFYKAGFVPLTKSAITNFSSNNPIVTLDYFAQWGNSTLSIAGSVLEMNFVSTEYYTSFRSRYAGLGYLTQEWYYDMDIPRSYMTIEGDYTKIPTKFVFSVNPVHQNDSPKYGLHYIWVEFKKG